MKKVLIFLVLIVLCVFVMQKGIDPLPTTSNASPNRVGNSNILLVNANNPLPRNYETKALINLYEQKNSHFKLSKTSIEINQEVYTAMGKMFSDANKDGLYGFIISSGYRSNAEQHEIYKSSTRGLAAKPGQSEHETGLAFDVITMIGQDDFVNTLQYKWLVENCGNYGFILRYPEGKESITGLPFESWHYRYVGLPHSKTIMEEGITLEEYLNK